MTEITAKLSTALADRYKIERELDSAARSFVRTRVFENLFDELKRKVRN